jgi:P27 family predicted phage terminase small subunit
VVFCQAVVVQCQCQLARIANFLFRFARFRSNDSTNVLTGLVEPLLKFLRISETSRTATLRSMWQSNDACKSHAFGAAHWRTPQGPFAPCKFSSKIGNVNMRNKLAPTHLSTESKAWFSAIIADYELHDHHLKLLQLACEAWDRCAEARAVLKKDGIVIEGREGGVRPHPAVAIERDSVNRFAMLVKQLGLDEEDQPRMGRPPNSLRFGKDNDWSRHNGKA